MNALSSLGLLATLILPATAATQGRVASLAQALETFNAVDSNKDGKLSPEEVAVFQLGRNDTRGVDVDRDESWSKEEFIVFYRQRLQAANLKPAADLEAEATRILAARKAKASERNAQPSLSEARRAAKQAQAQNATPLTDAIDDLQAKAGVNQAKDTDFDRVRDLLLADARAADTAAKGEDASLGEKSELHRKLMQSLDRLRSAAKAGTFSREEYQDFKQAIVKRARNAAAVAAPAQQDPSSQQLDAIEQGLNDALDRLEQRAAAGNATREDFDRVRDQLVSRARAAANGANGPGAIEVELQGPEHRKLLQSLDRLQAAAAAGTFSREEYRAFREALVKRFRKAGATGDQAPASEANAEAAAIEQGLTQALDQLEQRAAAGNASRADFQRVRDQLIARARAAANGPNGASSAEADLQGPTHRKLMQSLDRLEAAAQQGTFSREEYTQLRDSMIHRAREIQSAGSARPVTTNAAPDEAGMAQAADELQKRVDGGKVTPADFQKLRELISSKAQAAAGKSDPDSAKEALVYQKLMQSLDRLEKAAQSGSVDRQEFQAFKDSFVHRARQIASDSQQSNSSSSEQQSSEQNSADRSAAGKRSGAPVATPPAAQPLPADKGAAKRADPARDAGNKGGNEGTKPAPQPVPQPAPAERPKPAGQDPQPPPQPPHRPAPESGGSRPGG